MIDYAAIGQRIKLHRGIVGITQECLAEQINVSVPHISRIENGSSKPSLQVLVDICNTLEITIDDMMQDSISAAHKKVEGRLEQVLDGCTTDELSMVADLAEVVLRNIRQIHQRID